MIRRTAVFCTLLLGLMSLIPLVRANSKAGLSPQAFLPTLVGPSCVLYADDFSDPASGWAVGEDDVVVLAYLNETYQIQTKVDLTVIGSFSTDVVRAEFTIETDARFNAPPTDGLYGILFNAVFEEEVLDRYYFFYVYPDTQGYALLYRDPSGSFEFVSGTGLTSSAIQTGVNSNHLAVSREGDVITLQVNGVTLGAWTDDGRIPGPGYSGVAAWANSTNPTVDTRFDNFTVSACGFSTSGQAVVGAEVGARPSAMAEPLTLPAE